jgi:hypothetical protein
MKEKFWWFEEILTFQSSENNTNTSENEIFKIEEEIIKKIKSISENIGNTLSKAKIMHKQKHKLSIVLNNENENERIIYEWYIENNILNWKWKMSIKNKNTTIIYEWSFINGIPNWELKETKYIHNKKGNGVFQLIGDVKLMFLK